MKKMKKSLSLLLAAVLVFSLMAGVFSVSAAGLAVGDYVQFGSYMGNPILWRVINMDDEKGALLFSENILTLKAYDAAEPTQGLPADYPNFGNNYWETSNIRDWLNDFRTEVEWTMNPPKNAYVENGYNEYSDEPGFLSGFSKEDRALINDVEQNNVIDMISKNVAIGGTGLLTYNPNFENCMQNYTEAYYKPSSEKIFLLDLQQFHDYVYQRGFAVGKKPTSIAVNTSEYKTNKLATDKNWSYWLRTCRAEDNTSIRTVYYDQYVLDDQAYNGAVGVAPAMYLKKDAPVSGGAGSAKSPYVVGNSSTKFSDMGGFEWANEAINYLSYIGAVKGVGGNQFNPTAPVSRADFVLMMMRALGQTGTSKSNFKDVPQGSYYYDALGQAKIRAYIGGYEDGTFHPDAQITMEDIYCILSRVIAANKGVKQEPTISNLERYSDYNQIAGYAKEPMSWLVKLGVISDKSAKVYPKAAATRVDCAIAIFTMLDPLA